MIQGPIPQPDPTWLDYGAQGLLFFVLVAVFLLLRSYLLSVSQRMDKTSQFTESLVTKSMDSMDRLVSENQRIMSEHTVAQAEATAAMREVKNSLNNVRISTSKEHDELREDHRQIMGGLRGGLGRGTGD